MRYSIFNLISQALRGHSGWPRAWKAAEPSPVYDAVMVGGGGHGLATAWHLAREHGLRVAVLERGWIGSGNTGRNTTVIRSNYLREQAIRFQDENLRLWTDLSARLDFNLMVSHRGQIELLQTWGKLRDSRRRLHTMRMVGADYELLTVDQCYRMLPMLNRGPGRDVPVRCVMMRWPGATRARPAMPAWTLSRAAKSRALIVPRAGFAAFVLREAIS